MEQDGFTLIRRSLHVCLVFWSFDSVHLAEQKLASLKIHSYTLKASQATSAWKWGKWTQLSRKGKPKGPPSPLGLKKTPT